MTTAIPPPISTDALERAEASLGCLGARPRFEPELEERYEAASADSRARALRFWLLFGLGLRIVGLTNEVSIGGDVLTYGLVFRLGILVPVVLVSLVLLSPRYSRLTQGLAATTAPFLCVVGLAFLGTIAPAPNEVRYFFLAGVNIIGINIVMPLRFQHAAVFTAVSISAYILIAASGLGGIEFRDVSDSVFIFSVAAIASLAVTYSNEIGDRRAFLAHERINLQAAALKSANEELQRLLTTDALTGIYNRRYLDQSLQTSGERAIADRAYLGVVMVDVDHFKAYNDILGHRAGDECLREVAKVIVANVREGSDIVTRYGGEEFAVLVPGLPPEDTEALGERIRAAIEAHAIRHPYTAGARLTVSVGTAAGIPDEPQALERLLRGDVLERGVKMATEKTPEPSALKAGRSAA